MMTLKLRIMVSLILAPSKFVEFLGSDKEEMNFDVDDSDDDDLMDADAVLPDGHEVCGFVKSSFSCYCLHSTKSTRKDWMAAKLFALGLSAVRLKAASGQLMKINS